MNQNLRVPSIAPAPRRRRTLLAGAAVAVAGLAAPGTALAVTGTVAKPCFSHIPTKGSEPLVVALTGGTPGADYILAASVPGGPGTGSAGSTTGTFDGAGNATAQIENVYPPGGTINPTAGRKVDLTVQDYGAGGQEVPIGSALITNLTMSISSTPRSPRAHRKVAVSGTPFANQTLYGFVTKPGSSVVLRKVPLGHANACGYVSASRVIAPRTYRKGSYKFYVNAGPKLQKSKALAFSFRIGSIF